MTTEIAQALGKISDEHVATLERDGAVLLKGIFGSHWIEIIGLGIEKDLAAPGPYWRVQSASDDPGFFSTDYYLWPRIREFRDFALDGPGGVIASRLLRSAQINYFYEGLFVKEPGTVKPSLWHQDQVYYNVGGQKVLVMWIPVDPVSRETCLELVRGSHRWGKSFVPRMIKDDRKLEGTATAYQEVPDIDSNRHRYEILAWDMEPGDCIAFHGMMLHGSRGNSSLVRRRRAISTTWLGDDTVYELRPGEVEPRIEGHDFEPGDRLDVESVFPKVWPRADSREPR